MVEADSDPAPATTTAMFPVVLFDGEREMDVGNIKIHPDLIFKEFQMKLSQMIGISYNNLTSYLVDSRKSKLSTDRRKILITGKVNFSVLVREKNCYFLIVLKRSRRDRRRKPSGKQSDNLLLDFSLTPNSQIDSYNSPYYYHHHYDDRFHDLVIQRENYVNMILNSRLGYDSYDSPNLNNMTNSMNMSTNSMNMSMNSMNMNVNFPAIEEVYPKVILQRKRNLELCKECKLGQEKGKTPEFHLCVYDEVVVGGFRSPAGPISRPR